MTEIEGYRDLEVTGRSGFAVVYKARQISAGSDIASKLVVSNGASSELGRISGVIWGTSIDELASRGPAVLEQVIPNESGSHLVDFATTTDQIVLANTGVHDQAPNAGIAEILLQVEETSDN